MALLHLGLHQGFTTSYPDLKAPTKAHCPWMDDIVVDGGYEQGTSYLVILLTWTNLW